MNFVQDIEQKENNENEIDDDIIDNSVATEVDKDVIPLKKKRGRKPKSEQVIVVEKIELKKRGRKPTNKLFDKTTIEIIKNEPYEECIIINLPLNKNDIANILNKPININEVKKVNEVKEIVKINDLFTKKEQSDTQYISNVSMANSGNCNNCIELKKKINELELKYHIYKYNDDEKIKLKLNLRLEDIYDNLDYNTNNNLCCWWCCHTFDTLPLGLPDKMINNIFHVIGYFCSFNCALAYNMNLNDHRIWERMSLLYMLRNKICTNMIQHKLQPNELQILEPEISRLLGDIIISPPRYLLKMFGGHLDINEFREKSFILKKQFRMILSKNIKSIDNNIEESVYNKDQNLLIKPIKVKVVKKDQDYILKRTKEKSNKSTLQCLFNI